MMHKIGAIQDIFGIISSNTYSINRIVPYVRPSNLNKIDFLKSYES